MNKLITLFTVCSATVFVLAQKQEFLKMPKLTNEDLTKEKSQIDEKAPVELLYRSIHYRVDTSTGKLIKNFVYRVKVYDKDKAENWLNLEVSLYDNKQGDSESLNAMRAYVYNWENGNVAETKVDKSSKYKSRENKYITVNKYAFPNVKNGSVIEYSYEVQSPFLYELPLIYIELDTPSMYTEYVLDSPINMSYQVDYTGNLAPKHSKVEEILTYGVQTKTYRFAYEKVPAFKSEKFVKNNDNYRTKVREELHSTLFNNQFKAYTASWEDIRKKLWNHDEFGTQYKKNRAVKEIIPASISGGGTEISKAKLILDHVKNTFTWNKNAGFYTENGLKELIKTKTGNTSDLNLMLISMMRHENIKAYPILISTVGNGYVNTTFPNIGNFNYVIACAEINNQMYLFDATSKQSKVDLLPTRVWNTNGLLLKDDKAELINLNNINMSYGYQTVSAKFNADGSITGSYIDKDLGMYSMNAKESFDENPDKYRKQYKENFSVDFTDVNAGVLDNGDFEANMKFTSSNMVDEIGKKKIFNPLLFLNTGVNEFDQKEARKYTIDFISPFTKVKKVEIEIPEGYDVSDMPKSKKIVTDDKEISYSYIVEKKDNKIVVTSQVSIASADYPKEYYPAFKQIWKVTTDSESQVISLAKK